MEPLHHDPGTMADVFNAVTTAAASPRNPVVLPDLNRRFARPSIATGQKETKKQGR
jgi:hypothetical protein